MCGIAGWVSFDRDLRLEQNTIDTMNSTMALRGPDASGTWVVEHAALCHRRLAVIDIEGGVQPMSVDTPAGPVVLTYSGEVYNFVELREELRVKGHRFRTSSDTEVVLHAYLEWSSDFVDHLNGMFALAIWDSRSQSLLLVRDRLGIKPIFYFPTRDGVMFGSEPKAILANPIAPKQVRLEGLRELFVSRLLQKYTTPGQAVWNGMIDLAPGTVVTVDRSGIRSRCYWRLPAEPHGDDVPGTVEHVDALLHDIVERQLISDVPICTLLSGGLDSSTVAALAASYAAERGEHIRTFAVDFADYSQHFKADPLRNAVGEMTHDAPFADEAAQFLATVHQRVRVDTDTLASPDTRAATVAARDLPSWFGNRDYSAYLLFNVIREHATVALSGEAADEVFGGYPWMADLGSLDEGRLPWTGADGIVAGTSFLAGLYNRDFATGLDIEATTKGRFEDALSDVPQLAGEGTEDGRYRKLAYLALTRFVRNLLEKKDRMSMAAGLEVRVPFCDHRLVEYMFNTPWSQKRFDGREKSVLRATVHDALPQSVVMRKKSPWPDTQDPRFFALLREQLGDLVVDRDHPIFDVFDHTAVVELIAMPDDAGGAPRAACERILEVGTWLDMYQPQLAM